MANNGLTFEERSRQSRRSCCLQLEKAKAGQPALPPPPAADRTCPSEATAAADSSRQGPRIFLWRRIADDPRSRLNSMSFQEPFAIYLKASLLAGVVLASPWVFYQLWLFVAAGLYPRERRYVHVYLPFSVGLFLAGASLAFFVVFPPVLKFLLGFNSWQEIDPVLRINEWMGLRADAAVGLRRGLSIAAGHALPGADRRGHHQELLVVVAGGDPGASSSLAMILTPSGDPYSMCLMAVPLTVLYFGGILLCRYMPRHGRERDCGLGIRERGLECFSTAGLGTARPGC